MEITKILIDENEAAILLDLVVDRVFDSGTLIQVTPRWRAAAKQLAKQVSEDNPDCMNLLELKLKQIKFGESFFSRYYQNVQRVTLFFEKELIA